MQKLKVGDIVYIQSNVVGIRQYIIERVTATQAISGTTKFKNEPSENGVFSIIGPAKFGPYSGHTKGQIVEKYEMQEAIRQIRDCNLSKVPILKLKQIIEILKNG